MTSADLALVSCSDTLGRSLASGSLLADIEAPHTPHPGREEDHAVHEGENVWAGPAGMRIESTRDGQPGDEAECASKEGFKRGHTRHTHLG